MPVEKIGVTMLFYKLFLFKADLDAILKRYCCHGNVTYKFILTTVKHLKRSWIQIVLLKIIIVQIFDLNYVIFDFMKKCRKPP